MKTIQAVGLTLAILVSGLSNASAVGKPEDVIKYRHAIMESMSGHVAAILAIATNKIDAQQFLQGHADSLANLSAELDILFPEGTGGGETDALPEIWNDAEKFAAAIRTMQETANELQTTVDSGDGQAIMGSFAAVGKACKGCHESFRAEDDDSD